MYKEVFDWIITIERWSPYMSSAAGICEFVRYTGTYDMVCLRCEQINRQPYARVIEFEKVDE